MMHISQGTLAWVKGTVRLSIARSVTFYLLGYFAVVSCALSESSDAVRPGDFERFVAKLVSRVVPRRHYLRKRFNDAISEKLVDKYFRVLDPQRNYFMRSDLERFGKFRYLLDDLLPRGQIDFAYDVYELYLQRVRERLDYLRAIRSSEFDFTRDEDFLPDRSDEPWCESKEDLDEVWRLRTKNRVIAKLVRNEVKKRKSQEPGGENEESPPVQAGGPGDESASDSAIPPTQEELIAEYTAEVVNDYEKVLARLEEKDAIDVLEILLSALANVYDPHSTYMAPITSDNFDISMKLSLEGIGARLRTIDGHVTIVDVIPGGPADKDGRLQENDRIIAVAQDTGTPLTVINMALRKVVTYIRGPKGTRVVLTVLPAGADEADEPVKIDIIRDKVKLVDGGAKIDYKTITQVTKGAVDSDSSIADGDSPGLSVGVISLPSFYRDFGASKNSDDFTSSTRDILKLINDAKEKDISGLIIDLRRNKGGSLEEAIALAGLFITKGPVVQVRHANNQVIVHKDTDESLHYDGPLLVLTDKYSASSSEIFAAAIQDYKRGLVMGDRSTYGKGTVQTLHALESTVSNKKILKGRKPGTTKLTTAKFYRINGGSTEIRGVTPDIIMPGFREHYEIGEAYLEGALPWDEIGSLKAKSTVTIQSFRDDIIVRTLERLGQTDQFRELVADVEAYQLRKTRKTVSLNFDKRLEYYDEEKEWGDKISGYNLNKSTDEKKDWVLKEALLTMADLIDQSSNDPR